MFAVVACVRRAENEYDIGIALLRQLTLSTGVQRAMMEAMRKALEVPHMTFCDEVNADRLGELRSDLKEAAERRGARLSYLPLIVKVTKTPRFWLGQGLRVRTGRHVRWWWIQEGPGRSAFGCRQKDPVNELFLIRKKRLA